MEQPFEVHSFPIYANVLRRDPATGRTVWLDRDGAPHADLSRAESMPRDEAVRVAAEHGGVVHWDWNAPPDVG